MLVCPWHECPWSGGLTSHSLPCWPYHLGFLICASFVSSITAYISLPERSGHKPILEETGVQIRHRNIIVCQYFITKFSIGINFLCPAYHVQNNQLWSLPHLLNNLLPTLLCPLQGRIPSSLFVQENGKNTSLVSCAGPIPSNPSNLVPMSTLEKPIRLVRKCIRRALKVCEYSKHVLHNRNESGNFDHHNYIIYWVADRDRIYTNIWEVMSKIVDEG